MPFADRADAGRRLADRLNFLRGSDVVVLGLPRGGVPVAAEVSRALGAPLDVIVVRKLGVPFQPELGMGAIAEGGVRIINEQVVRMAGISDEELAGVEEEERVELERRAASLRHGRPTTSLVARTAVVVDDGMATGSTAKAACRAARARGAERVLLAVPVASPEAVVDLAREAEVVCLESPHTLWAVGQWYDDFRQTSDEEVASLLEEAARPLAREDAPETVAIDPAVSIAVGAEGRGGRVVLRGELSIPRRTAGIVIFAHGGGSSRHSPRNRFVASRLNRDGLATLLFDLLTPAEELDRGNVFDIDLLGGRLAEVAHWIRHQPQTAHLSVGFFGASTGAAAALWAGSEIGTDVAAIVSRGGRPDLAGPRLARVKAPTLLIVGGDDTEVLKLNRQAQMQLGCENRLVVVPGATHLFQEPGTLAAAAGSASQWFGDHFTDTRRPAA